MLRNFQIMAFKYVAGTSLNSHENIFYLRSTYYQIAVFISTVFVTHHHLDPPKVVQNRSFPGFK